jgi:enamine deaminase RidA (YjgF/YER057c/UK114 family)
MSFTLFISTFLNVSKNIDVCQATRPTRPGVRTRVRLVIERHRDGSAFEATASYCRAVRSGPAVAVSGTAATGPDGSALHPGDTYAQTREAFARAVAAAGALGAELADTVRTRLFLAPESDWREAVEAHREVFEGVDPANTTLFVAGFIPPGVLVEVELDAWVSG